MNRSLIEYGIQTEESDFRAHVSFQTGKVYFFPTVSGKAIIEQGDYPARHAFQPGYDFPTAKGYLVPPFDIEGCQEIDIPLDIRSMANCQQKESTSQKGEKAVRVVANMLCRGLIPITLKPTIISERDLQIKGLDITVKGEAKIQVKCDYSAGRRELGGTGNLYLQIAECNPLGAY